MDFQPHGERMCKIRIRGKPNNVTLLNVYAPTEEKSEVNKNTFYESMEKIYDQIPKIILELYCEI